MFSLELDLDLALSSRATPWPSHTGEMPQLIFISMFLFIEDARGFVVLLPDVGRTKLLFGEDLSVQESELLLI